MLGSVAVLERPIVRKIPSVSRLRLVPMPEATATYIGEIYAKAPPEGRLPHPQDRPLRELWQVEALNVTENGVYAFRTSKKAGIKTVYLSEAEKNQIKLPPRTGFVPAFGRDEVDLEPHPIQRGSDLWKLITRSYRKECPDTKFDFV